MPANDLALLDRSFRTILSGTSKVTVPNLETVIKQVSKDGVTQSERRQFREKFYQNKDRFEPAAQKRANDFIEKEIPKILVPDADIGGSGQGTIPDPKVLKED